MFGVNGLLNGPGGRGSTGGSGGRRRIGVSSCRSASYRNVNEFSVLEVVSMDRNNDYQIRKN